MLKGPAPRLIDEWQLEPRVWNHVRRAVDDRRAVGQFILTGSAIPADDATRHTGMRRIARLRLRPMSLHESGRSSGAVSLARLLAGEPPRAGDHHVSIAEIAELICRGGWPESVDWPLGRALRANRSQIEDIARVDIRSVDGVRRDPQRVRLLMRSLARNVGTAAATSKLVADVGARDNGGMRPQTAADYLGALERIMIVENQPAWATHLRSRAALRKRPVRHFVDPSLAAAALGADPARLLRDFGFLGLLFESMVVRDLRVYAQAAEADVFHYRENGRLEVDAVVQARDGRWAAFEVKLGPKSVNEGARNLLRLAERVDCETVGPAPGAVRDRAKRIRIRKARRRWCGADRGAGAVAPHRAAALLQSPPDLGDIGSVATTRFPLNWIQSMAPETGKGAHGVRYEPHESPPWPLAAGLAMQYSVLAIGGVVLTVAIVLRSAGSSAGYLAWGAFSALLVSGVATILQARRVGRLGSGYVLMMGTSGVFIAVSVAALREGGPGLLASLIIVSSLFQFLLAGRLSILRRILTPTVAGTVIMLTAVNIMPFLFDFMDNVPEGTPRRWPAPVTVHGDPGGDARGDAQVQWSGAPVGTADRDRRRCHRGVVLRADGRRTHPRGAAGWACRSRRLAGLWRSTSVRRSGPFCPPTPS